MAKIISNNDADRMIADAKENLVKSGESEVTAEWAVNYAIKRTRGVVNDLTDDVVLQEKLLLENLPKALKNAKRWISREKKVIQK